MEKLITGLVFICIGLLLFFNNKNIAKGAAHFYQKFYTENNLKNLFRVLGAILLLAGLALTFFSNYL
jgi:hypothetical protein